MSAMDTSGRAILLAGTTVVIALLGMFATGVAFLFGLAIASVLAVLLTLAASLTILPAMLSRWGHRIASAHLGRRARGPAYPDAVDPTAPASPTAWRRWSDTVQKRPRRLAFLSMAVMVALLIRCSHCDSTRATPATTPPTRRRSRPSTCWRRASARASTARCCWSPSSRTRSQSSLPAIRAAAAGTADVAAVAPIRLAPNGQVAVMEVYPKSAAQAAATTDLVNRLRHNVLPPLERSTRTPVLVGGFTAGSIDFSNVLGGKLRCSSRSSWCSPRCSCSSCSARS